ncbi:MAG: hypothetical protein IGS39_26820 [Calothrix sp. C42_A2020_038]|nr:hypothetical protein [Calothrix sp. C42_A2020_038]
MVLNIVNAIFNVVSSRKEIAYILGRFKTIRRFYRKYSKIKQLTLGFPKNINYESTTFFQDIPIDLALKYLNKNAVFLGLKLPQEIVDEIREFSKNTLLGQENTKAHFYYHDVKNGYLPDGRVIVQGIAVHPLKCNAIQQIINDPILRVIIEKYLGYSPKNIRTLLKWSFVLELTDEDRMKLNQGNIYHYDVGEFNSVYANFYLTNTDRYSGAHAMIKGSHNYKNLKMLFNSAQPKNILIKYYGQENEMIIEGDEGIGFIQDPYCYHRAIPPIKEERLLLQIQFS